MIELIVKNFFDDNFHVPLLLEYPDEKPDFFVLFEKTSSGKNNKLDSCTVAFQSYAPSLYEAAKLNEDVKKTVENLIILDEIARVKLNADYNYTDTERKEYRYQAVYDINYY